MLLRFIAASDDDQRRLDRVLRKALPDLPLSALHRLFRKGKITVNGKAASPDERIRTGQIIELPETRTEIANKNNHASAQSPETRQLSGSFIKMIIYEGEGLLVLNKASGIAVHGPDSLNEQVYAYLKPKLPSSLSFMPGPLHRLDKPSSGLIVFSTSLTGARFFSSMMRGQKLRKQYLAIVDGVMEKKEFWEDELVRDSNEKKTYSAENASGKKRQARTRISVLASAQGHSLILAEIETGITHQIRAQCSIHGHPLSGDNKYGGRRLSGERGFLLHAWKLEFKEPCSASVPAKFEALLPENFRKKIDSIFGNVTFF
jgi:23S rRNA pseudouridine955/2504/2580 synthase